MKIKTPLKILGLMAVVALFSACASNHMTPVAENALTAGPAPGKALIHFMRPSSFGGAIQSTVWDGESYIGTVSANSRVCYQAEPGEHMFMVVGESADFMQAELLPGKTYYAVVTPRPGFWKARFSLRPMNGQEPQENIDKWVAGTREVSVNDSGRQWAAANQDSVMRMKERYLPVWMEKSESDKQILNADSGR